ncbi:MAG: ABC transporter ATP-binding protein [Oscillospiraceae bacterium]|jgi:ABC-2 type transport system ATP-binding protein|nr:ABC transporter ATP-binding protein [Oscillospiraceae bacterium]MDD3260961.1 ABC transporter ATP-binding protein [Oscillospiraceae bacterium]
MDAIITDRLTKSYDHKTNALEALSLSVPAGTAYALLGSGGAGKTTAVKLLSGLITPSSGSCSILQIDPAKQPSRLHGVCGVMTSSARLYGCLTGQENLQFFGAAAGMKAADAHTRTAELMKDLGIWSARDLPVSEYPTNMLQRLSLARALLARPQVLLLDEPLFGLDPESAQAVLGLLGGLVQQEGMTILLCTHFPPYAQQLCTEFGILCEGSVIAGGTLPVLCQKAGCQMRAGLRLPEKDSLAGFSLAADGFWQKEIKNEDAMPEILREAVAEGHDIYEARLYRPTLADVYTALLGKEELP